MIYSCFSGRWIFPNILDVVQFLVQGGAIDSEFSGYPSVRHVRRYSFRVLG